MRFILGLLIGVAIGAALGMLAAPRPGSETRHELGQRLRRGAEEAEESVTVA
jgi:gas vesicle protein